jgi:hypothetical protein
VAGAQQGCAGVRPGAQRARQRAAEVGRQAQKFILNDEVCQQRLRSPRHLPCVAACVASRQSTACACSSEPIAS